MVLQDNRLYFVRRWLIIVESYFIWRSCLIIWPKYLGAVDKDLEHGDDVAIYEEAI